MSPQLFLAILLAVTSAVSLCDARLTDHFINWLDENGYESYGFQRDDIGGRSEGGKANDADTIVNQPVIFVHGLSGDCYDFNNTRDILLETGYKNSEIYATTWGIPKSYDLKVYFSRDIVLYVRKFADAVLNYTGAPKVDVIGHSMGVIFTRIAIKGGQQWDGVSYEVGDNLTSRIDTYIGVAGPNQGANFCYSARNVLKGCNDKNGLYPGIMTGTEVIDRSELLEDLNSGPRFEGDHVFSIYSIDDGVFGNGGLVYCEYTCHVPGSRLDIRLDDPMYNHLSSLTLTGPTQVELLKNQQVSREFKKWAVKSESRCAGAYK